MITPALIESPSFFLQTLYQGVKIGSEAVKETEKRVQARIDEWRASVPQDKHEEFDEILDVGRRFFRLRDERGLYTDLAGVGLCRRGILEGGRRLEELGVINQADHLTCATKHEAIALLSGDLGSLRMSMSQKGIVEIPTANELERRYKHIHDADPSSVPRARTCRKTCVAFAGITALCFSDSLSTHTLSLSLLLQCNMQWEPLLRHPICQASLPISDARWLR